MSTCARIAVLSALCLLLMCCRFGFAQEAAQAPVLREVIFAGIEALPPAIGQQLTATAAPFVGQPFAGENAQALQDALEGLGWFRRVILRQEAVADGVRVTVELDVNPTVQQIVFSGNSVFSDARLLAAIGTRPGEILNQRQVTQDVQAIEQLYARAGYTLVEVVDVAITQAGQLSFVISEPVVSEIRIQGNNRTRAGIILRAITVEPGDVFNLVDAQESLRNLQSLNIFTEVNMAPQAGPEPGTLILLVNVRERPRTGYVTFGGTYSEVGGFSGFVNFAEANLFGLAHNVSLQVQGGARDVYRLNYFIPLLDERRTSLGASLYDVSLPRQTEFAGSSLRYDEERQGGSLTLARPVGRALRLSATMRAESVATTSPEAGGIVPSVLIQEAEVRSLATSLVRDTRRTLAYPTQGSYASATLEYAGLFGGANYAKLAGDTRRYWVVRGRTTPAEDGVPPTRLPWVLAMRLLAGSSLNDPPLTEQFLLGGAADLRGYPEGRFPGENVLLASSELRIPLSSSLQAALFIDAGDAWGGRVAEVVGDDSFTLRTGYGVGIRIQTPVGPVRLDYAINDTGGSQFHLGIGPAF